MSYLYTQKFFFTKYYLFKVFHLLKVSKKVEDRWVIGSNFK